MRKQKKPRYVPPIALRKPTCRLAGDVVTNSVPPFQFFIHRVDMLVRLKGSWPATFGGAVHDSGADQ